MPVYLCLLRGVNVGGHNRIKMELLRTLVDSLGFEGAQTLVQSGNVVFRAKEKNALSVAGRIADGIERKFGFRPGVVLRTTSELRAAIAANPFAAKQNADPSKLLVTFYPLAPGREAREVVLGMKTSPEELVFNGRELYIYFPEGIGRTKLSMPKIERALKMSGTGRNWNTVQRLLELAEALEAGR